MSDYILGIGAANIDISGFPYKQIVMHDSNDGPISTSTGGVTRNIIENLVRLGLPCSLITTVGEDLNGNLLLSDCAKLGINAEHSLVLPDKASSTYMAVMDDKGDLLVSICDMSIIKCLTPDFLATKEEHVKNAKAIVCDPSIPVETLDYMINDLSGDIPVFIDPVNTSYTKKIEPFIGGVDTFKPNQLELEYMTGIQINSIDDVHRATDKLLKTGLRRVIVSRGSEGCVSATSDGGFMVRSLKSVTEMVNATGAGDSLMAGIIYSYFNGYTEEQALDFGMACGIAAILSEKTINPKLCKQLILAILDTYKVK